MGSKYPVSKPQEIVKVLQHFGFNFKSQKGSHAKYIKLENERQIRIVIVPLHDEVAKGTLKSILQQAGLTLDEFLENL